MVISYNRNTIICNSAEEFEKQIIKAFSDSDIEIWISENAETDDLPCIGILINDKNAVVNFFNKNLNYVSVGDKNRNDFMDFCNGEYSVQGYQIIPKGDALKCTIEFYETKICPECIQWEEL